MSQDEVTFSVTVKIAPTIRAQIRRARTVRSIAKIMLQKAVRIVQSFTVVTEA